MAKFYLAMLRSENARKLYVQVLLVLLLLFHYVYVSGHFGDYGAVLSTILCTALFSNKRAMRWMERLHESRRRFGILALLAMVIAAVPHMYTMSMTIAFFFWPACSIRRGGQLPNGTTGRHGSTGRCTQRCCPATTISVITFAAMICG